MEWPADWKALESFAEYRAWDTAAVTRNLTRLVEEAPSRPWHGYHVSAVDRVPKPDPSHPSDMPTPMLRDVMFYPDTTTSCFTP